MPEKLLSTIGVTTEEQLQIVRSYISATLSSNQKLTLTDLRLFGRTEEKALEGFKNFLLSLPQNEAVEIWKKLKKEVTNKVLLKNGETVSLEIIKKFNIQPAEVQRAFLNIHPHSPSFREYSPSFALLYAEDVQAFVDILNQLDLEYAKTMINETGITTILLLIRPEIDVFKEENGTVEFEVAIRQGLDFLNSPLLNWLQKNTPEKFAEACSYITESSKKTQEFVENSAAWNKLQRDNAEQGIYQSGIFQEEDIFEDNLDDDNLFDDDDEFDGDDDLDGEDKDDE